MEINFFYSRDEWISARRKYLVISKTVTVFQVISMVIFAIAIGIMVAVTGFSLLSITATGITIVYAIVLAMLYFWQPGHIFDNTQKYHEEYHLQFLQDKIIFQTKTVSSEIKWNIYLSYVETDDFFYLIQSRQTYFIIPKRALGSDNEINLLRALIKSNVKKP